MKALDGIRLLDLTHMVAGPYAGMMLADLGAETIKIEPPGGEGARVLLADDPHKSLHGMGAYFITLNRNKKGVALDLKSAGGLDVFYRLVKVSDVVLDNFSVGVTERLNIHHTALREINPGIVTCSITGFGETGPDRERPAFDMVAQAISGQMSITGQPGGEPIRFGVPIADLGAGLMAAIGVLSALVARHQTGRGQHVNISMLDGQISLLSYVAAAHLMSGEVPVPMGNEHFLHVPYDTFAVQDGYIVIAVIYDSFWESLMGIVGLPELDTDENQRAAGRRKNRVAINRCLAERFEDQPQAYWLEKLHMARIPCAAVNTVERALNDPQVLARNMVVEVAHPLGGRARVPGNPVKLSDHEDAFAPPPLLGQHTHNVLSAILGMSQQEMDRLRAQGAIA